MIRSVIIKRDGRVDGDYSLYVEGAPNGACYTGLTFGSFSKATKVARYLNEELGVIPAQREAKGAALSSKPQTTREGA